MLQVMGQHREAAQAIDSSEEDSTGSNLGELTAAARDAWDRAVELGRTNGYRNAQATVIAPTGTIAFMMDCDTTGVEPDIGLVKYKKLVGGGMMKMVNKTVPLTLSRLGYEEADATEIVRFARDLGRLRGHQAPAQCHV